MMYLLDVYTEDRLIDYTNDNPTYSILKWYKNIQGVDLIGDKFIANGVDSGIRDLIIIDKHFHHKYLTYHLSCTCDSELPPEEVPLRVQYYFNHDNEFDYGPFINSIKWTVKVNDKI